VGPTCQTPLSVPGPPGSAPLPRGFHAPCHSSALKALSGPRVGVPTAPFRPAVRNRRRRLTSARPILTAPSPLSEAAPPPCPNPAAIWPSDAVVSFVHGERRPSSPLAVLRPWSVELTFPSLLTGAGPPPATVAPPRRRNTAAEPEFFPSLSMRSSGELFFPPPCPAGSLTVVGARPPPFVPPPSLWHHRRPCRDACPGAVTASACAAWFRPSDTRISFSIF
jgi:hypothetical protein